MRGTRVIGLHFSGHEGVVKLLLETGKVDVDARNKSDQSPLFWAAKNGHEGVVKLLLETGKVDINVRDQSDWSSLLWVVGNGHEGVVNCCSRRERWMCEQLGQ
jgi:ankyrin repeat protein